MISKNKTKLIHSLATKKGRDKAGCFVAEGPKVCQEFLAAGFRCTFVAQSEEVAFPLPPHCETAEASEQELRQVSFLQHPQGVLGVFEIPGQEFTPPDKQSLHLALDGVQDPGNLGTIIRVADWFGISTIYCSHDTADCWNPKVVQATMGSLARVHILYTDLAELLDTQGPDCPVYGTLLDGRDLYAEPLTPHGIIVMGNEGNGISPAIRQRVNCRLLIPSYPKDAPTAESLNVAIATAITLAEFRRRM